MADLEFNLPVIHVPTRRPLHERNIRIGISRSLSNGRRRRRRQRSQTHTIQIHDSDDDSDSGEAGVCIDLTTSTDAVHVDEDVPVIDLTSPTPAQINDRRHRSRRVPDYENIQVSSDSDSDIYPLEPLDFSSETSSQPGATGNNVMSPGVREISCPICMDDQKQIQKSGRQLASTICGHVFCLPCVRAAVTAQRRCPSCRKRLSLKQIHSLFI